MEKVRDLFLGGQLAVVMLVASATLMLLPVGIELRDGSLFTADGYKNLDLWLGFGCACGFLHMANIIMGRNWKTKQSGDISSS